MQVHTGMQSFYAGKKTTMRSKTLATTCEEDTDVKFGARENSIM